MVTHVLFLYGQIAPMWKLSLTAEDISIWANSTNFVSDTLFDALSLDHHYHYTLEHNVTVREFTYGAAVQELWDVRVIGVRTQNRRGKPRRYRVSHGYTKSWKKAIVQLHDDDRIAFF